MFVESYTYKKSWTGMEGLGCIGAVSMISYYLKTKRSETGKRSETNTSEI